MDLPLSKQPKRIPAPGPRHPRPDSPPHSRPHWAGALLALLVALAGEACFAQEHPPAPTQDPVDDYLQAIDRALTLGGPYAIELIDLYFGYGQSLMEEGDFEGARDAFHRTAMVSRVNSGPNSLDQTNYLYSIAQVESLLGNFGASVGVLENIYSLHANLYGENDPAMLPVVQQIFTWYSETAPLNVPLARASDYLNRSYLVSRIAALTEADRGIGNSQTALRYREEGQLRFRAIYYMLQSGEPPQPEFVINDDGRGNQWYFERTLQNHFKAGEEAFARVEESWRSNPDATELEIAEAIAQRGDWYLALQHFRSASKQYERAYRLLAQSKAHGAMADTYLGVPAPLRFLNTTDRFVPEIAGQVPEGGLEVSMTVSRNGRLTNVQIVKAPEGESDEDLQALARRLESTRFRPAVIDGKVERMEHFVWKPPMIVRKVAAADG